MRGSFVADFSNDLDHNVFERLLRVYVGNSDLAILKVELLDTIVDGLQTKSVFLSLPAMRKAYPLANRDVDFLRFYTRYELRPFVIIEL